MRRNDLMFTEDEIGDKIMITLAEITEEEFAEIQNNEFQGW